MLQINISNSDIQLLNYERFHYPSIFIRKRFHAIYLKSQNLEHQMIAQILDIHQNSVTNYIHMFIQGGVEKLKQNNYGTNVSELNKDEELTNFFKKNFVYSINQAVDYIAKKTGLKRSPTCVRNYLHRLKIKPRMTGHIPAKADTEKQKDFLEQTLQPVIKQAEKQECTILFLDAAHFVLGVFLTVVWSLKRVFLPAPAGRQRYNVLGAINPITYKISTICNVTYINAKVIAQFLKQLATEYVSSQ